MDYDITLKFLFICFLLLLSGFFSGSEAALFSITDLHLHKMREDKNPFFAYIQRLLRFPRRLLITILVGNESVNITISAIATSLFIYLLGEEGKWVAIAVTTVTLLIIGEAIPKTFAVNYPMRFSMSVSLPLILFSKIARPVVWVLEKISAMFVYLFGKTVYQESPGLTEDEFITLVDVGHEEGALEESERDLIHKVFELADTDMDDVMTPRVDMFCLPVTMNIDEISKQIITARYSRIPIYGNDRDDILGILHARHVLEKLSQGRKTENVRKLLKKPFYVPLERTAESVLRDFQIKKTQMAIVVDEYGGIEGLVTLNDIMESLVGDIYDEYDERERLFHRVTDGTLIVSGSMDIEDFNELMGTTIPIEEFDTVGGFIFHLFGELPAKGDEVDFDNYTFKVEKISGARIIKARVIKKEEPHDG
ncbi:MAG: hemolysin family protein [Deltaproteobacteria bacterium]|nr:hemolysin family protein [Deltaproteobacteria bacterium]